jgi:hypothetical protein
MGTLVLLSSSPPRSFARSPTPAASSSPALASPFSTFHNGHKGFNNASAQRDGFSAGFNNTRSIFGKKVGSENLPFSVTKSQQSSGNAAKGLHTKLTSVDSLRKDGAMPRANRGARVASAETLVEERGKTRPAPLAATKASGEDAAESVFTTEADLRAQSRALSPLLLDKAPFRRLDWTPPKRDSKNVTELELEEGPLKTSFPGGLLRSFGYEGESAKSSLSSRDNEGCAPTKRRRLDFVDNGSRKPSNTTAALKPAPALTSSEIAPKERRKSLKKKYTTITGIATAHYFGEDQGERDTRPMLQYLAATQARDVGDSQEPSLDTTKQKRASKKTKAKKKQLPTSVLLSPESAMKAIDGQDMLFGSASQLARDESPTFIRDTVDATKQSESSFTYTPVPTQNTVPSEPGSATRRGNQGMFRFVKSRNLWATASRDDDNALLQIDTIDLFDSPDLRHAFTGKDAMLEPTAPRHRELRSPEKALPALSGGHLGRSEITKSNGWLDIDNIGITTPTTHVAKNTFTQRRAIHVASEPLSKRAKSPLDDKSAHGGGIKKSSSGNHELQPSAPVSVGVSGPTEPPRLRMPAFGGFTTGELSNQLKKYGFKPIKKREKMIEVLQSCWEAKHQSNTNITSQTAVENVPDEELEVATHGDILSKVHGLATRPTPKVVTKKIPRPRDKSATPAKPARRKAAEDDEDVGKTPKQRKKAEPKAKEPKKSKADKARKSKASAVSAEYVIDISDIEDIAIDEPRGPANSSPVPASQTGRDTAMQSAACLPTPPLTLPSTISAGLDEATPRPLENRALDLPDINSQITDAITKYVASPTRDHQRNPTWHEKILMYDPIVLEDLATWLNTEGLALIGEDREVSALEVRSWCEMKGVCCYGVGGGWRGNVKGKARARGDEAGD